MTKRSLLHIFLILLAACESSVIDIEKEAAHTAMENHLNAVSKRNINDLMATLSPDDEMTLILPQSEIIDSKEGFIEYHRKWFEDQSWTFEYKILKLKAGTYFSIAVVEVLYKEPERNGKPYFNRMIVSYVLEKKQGKWCVIKDHASSIEKGVGKSNP